MNPFRGSEVRRHCRRRWGGCRWARAVGGVGWVWQRIEPLLPRRQRRIAYPRRKPLDDIRVLQGILFVLHTGIGWEHLSQELGFGCGMTAWRRLRSWQQAGVWEKLHELLPAELQAADRLEWERAIADSRHLQAKKGARNRSQPRRSRPGGQAPSPRRGGGVPLAWTLTGGNRNSVTRLLELLDRVPVPRPDPVGQTPTADAERRPWLRSRQVPQSGPGARRQAADRTPSDRARLRARPPQLGRRAHLRLAPQLPPTAHRHRPPRRHQRSLAHPRLLPHLLATAGDPIGLGPLSRTGHISPTEAEAGCRWTPRTG
jgi:transposase